MALMAQDLRDHATLGYKLRILIYDLCNVGKQPSSQQRLETALDEFYLSPYFNVDEALLVRNALVIPENDANQHNNDDGVTLTQMAADQPTEGNQTVEQAIHSALAGFFDKRKASGDARPCGPHTLAPVYLDVFGLSRSDVQTDQFLARLKRQGVPQDSKETMDAEKTSSEKMNRKGKTSKAHGKKK